MRKALVLGVAVLSLIAFSGLAAGGTVWFTYYYEANSEGWLDYGMIGNYHVLGKYNYREEQVYGMDYGWIYLMKQDIHSQWHTKCLDGNKPITIGHYNGLIKYEAEVVDAEGTYVIYKDIARGFWRIIDPKASDLGYNGGGQASFWYPGLTPVITKFMDLRRPMVDDATTLTSMIFEKVDFALVPLIEYAYFEMDGNTVELDVAWY